MKLHVIEYENLCINIATIAAMEHDIILSENNQYFAAIRFLLTNNPNEVLFRFPLDSTTLEPSNEIRKTYLSYVERIGATHSIFKV